MQPAINWQAFFVGGVMLWGRSELLAYSDKESPARSILRREDADARAVSDLINIVEEVDDVETHRQRPQPPLRLGHCELMRQTEIDLRIGRDGPGIGEAIAQATAINQVGTDPGPFPKVGNPARATQRLGMIRIDIMI
jgi:hypothetical protein